MSKKSFMDCGGNLILGLTEVFAGIAYINRAPGPKSKLNEKLKLWHYESVASNPWKTHPQYEDRNKEYVLDYIEYLKNRRAAQSYYQNITDIIHEYFGSCTIKTIQPVRVSTDKGEAEMLGDWDFVSLHESMMRLKYLRPYRNDRELWLSILGSHIIESAFDINLRPMRYKVIEVKNGREYHSWVDKSEVKVFNKESGNYDITMIEYENQIYSKIINIYKNAVINGVLLEKRLLIYPKECSSIEEYRKYEEYDFDYSTYHSYALQNANQLRLMPDQIKADMNKKTTSDKTIIYCY